MKKEKPHECESCDSSREARRSPLGGLGEHRMAREMLERHGQRRDGRHDLEHLPCRDLEHDVGLAIGRVGRDRLEFLERRADLLAIIVGGVVPPEGRLEHVLGETIPVLRRRYRPQHALAQILLEGVEHEVRDAAVRLVGLERIGGREAGIKAGHGGRFRHVGVAVVAVEDRFTRFGVAVLLEVAHGVDLEAVVSGVAVRDVEMEHVAVIEGMRFQIGH